jgi:ribosomal protein L33
MPRGKRTNVALICSETGMANYVIRLIKDSIKDFKVKKYCPKLRKRTIHKPKEIKKGS